MSGGKRGSLIEIFQGGVRWFSSIGASSYFGIRAIASPAQNIILNAPTTQPSQSTDQIIVLNGTQAAGYQLSFANVPAGGGGGEANTITVPSVPSVPGAVSPFMGKSGVNLQLYGLLPLNTPALTIATGINTLDISIANAVPSGNAGFMTGADKAKLDGVATGATANATNAQLRDRSTHTGTQDFNTLVNVPSYQSSNARLTALSGFANPATVKLTQLGTDGVLTLVDPPSGFNPGSQSPNVFYASPNGSAGNPTFRSLAWGDVSGLAGTTGSSFALGNDARFHNRNQDTGTNSTTFVLDTGGTPVMLKDSGGGLQIRNGADTANADLTAANVNISGNLTVSGNTTFVQPETVQIQDNIIQINSDFTTGTPTQDLGIEGLRGSSPSAQLLWSETAQKWQAGTVGNTFNLPRIIESSFTNANLTGGVLTVNHNLGRLRPGVFIYDNNGDLWSVVDNIKAISSNQLTVDMTTLGTLPGTWGITIIG
jgi:hypothetical protein